jgi:hypothetical protein
LADVRNLGTKIYLGKLEFGYETRKTIRAIKFASSKPEEISARA